MAIDNREALTVGMKLQARFKGEVHEATVIDGGDGKIAFKVGDETFNSLSKAGSHVCGGTSVNGWRFWSLEGELGEPRQAKAKADGEGKTKGKAKTKPENRGPVDQIKKARKQDTAPEGQVLWFCSACMEGFHAPKGETPNECPNGHPRKANAEEDAGQPEVEVLEV